MQKKAVHIILLFLIFGIILTGCTNNTSPGELKELEEQLADKENLIESLTAENDALKEQLSGSQTGMEQSTSVLAAALNAVQYLQDEDMAGLSSIVHPTAGVRITPYSFIKLQDDLVFTSQQITGLLQNSQVYTWGEFDGTGDPIQLNFSDYYDRFVYDQDFANPHMIGNNTVIGTGNMINNITQAYPNGTFVEFHFTGFDPQYGGMDWRSLRLVFEDVNGIWYLVGIVHDEWTI